MLSQFPAVLKACTPLFSFVFPIHFEIPPLALLTIKRQPHGIERSLSPVWKLEIYRKLIITLRGKIKFHQLAALRSGRGGGDEYGLDCSFVYHITPILTYPPKCRFLHICGLKRMRQHFLDLHCEAQYLLHPILVRVLRQQPRFIIVALQWRCWPFHNNW